MAESETLIPLHEALRRNARKQPITIHAVDKLHAAYDIFDFIGLQVADEMHRRVRMRALTCMQQHFLRAVFAKAIHQPGALADERAVLPLAYRAQYNIRRLPPCALGGIGHARTDASDVGSDICAHTGPST